MQTGIMPEAAADERVVLRAISDLESSAGRKTIEQMCKLSTLHLSINKRSKALECLTEAGAQFLLHPTTAKEGLAVVEASMAYWRAVRFLNKEMRLNTSAERAKVLSDTSLVLEASKALRDPSMSNIIPLKIAFGMECAGQFQESIAVLSDLITAQAMDGVDLNYIIFKAAVLLKHMNGFNQAIEYLEFLSDEPPETEGLTKTHVLAFLALVYEQHPEKNDYVVVLGKTYDDLVEAYKADMATGKRPVTNQVKIDEMLAKKSIGQSSEIWEMLALQAVDRCEYMLAFEFMQQAVEKAPNKPKLLHLLSEVSFFLGMKEKALGWAERAFNLQPQSSDLRNLLLLLAPGKWQDKLRNAATSVSLSKPKDEDRDASNLKLKKSDNDEEDDGSFFGALKDGASGLFAPASPEQKLKQAEKDKKKKEKAAKQAKKAKKDADRATAAATAVSALKKKVPGKKRDPEIDGYAKPPKPFTSRETIRIFHLLRDGNKHIHVYDPILAKFLWIQDKLRLKK